MKRLHRILLCGVLAAGASFTASAQPAGSADHNAHHPQAAAAADMAEGEVRKVDKAAGKITVRHGEIRNLDMPPMTMVFGVSDPAMLDKVKQGDKVRFRAANPNGNYTITEIQAAGQ
ncbi:copper-binding protein [Ramlibacter pallidus]|uniref:Copper-binding protein n=1 Tax=Ramlibacter pallidus TaxID=2780087 RepID=A0ABR9RXT3_9BURK|nr:copper-binding protein [Ramlibacter pallidus]MBE7366048.1 copper-binding protein [Ramlibacter pallidus]